MVLKDFILNNHTWELGVEVNDCDEAIRIAAGMLVKAGAAEERYPQAVIDITTENGPYYVIAPGIAMPHARPESGAIKTGFALMTLKKPVVFGNPDNDPVDIILCICAKNKEELNNEVIINAMCLLEDETILDELRHASSKEDLVKIFEKVEAMNE